jgi:PAS domain S-box-containing protein
MFRFRDYSIAKKLTWMNMLVSGAALLLACAAFVTYGLVTFREALVANLSIQAQVVGTNSISALLFNDPGSAEKTLAALQAAPNIDYASIYTPDGQPFAAYWRDPARQVDPLPSILAVQTEIHWFKDKQITVVRPILFLGKPAGVVCIRSDLRQWTASLQRYAIIVAAVLLVSLMAALLTSTATRRAIADPIVRLAETARIVSREKNYSIRAPVTSNHDELAILISTFNEMLAQIQERDTALQSEIAERTKTEKALHESQDRLTGILGSATDAIITVDRQQCIVLFNAAAEKMFLCTAVEALGHSIERFMPQRFRAQHASHIQRFGETGVTNRAMGALGALWGVRSDGQEFQIEASISQLESGGKKLFTVILRDVTERKRAEEVRERLAAVVESTDDAIISKTLDGTITAWNRGAQKLFGYSSSEALGKSMRMLIPPERAGEESDILARIGLGESVDHFETVRVRKDGKSIDISATISPIRDGNGAVVGASKIARDITERKRVEERLAAQAKELTSSRQALETQSLMLQSVLDSMAEGLVAADEQGKFLIWNRAAERIVGYGPADLPSQEWSEHYGNYLPDGVTLFPTEQLPLVRAIHGEASTAEIFLRNPKVTQGGWIEASGSPLRGKDGVVHGGVVAFRDITQRKADEREILKLYSELEQRVADRTAQLETANKELEAFSYSVSHDLRAPLRHIIGFSKMLLEEFGPTLDPGAQHYLDRIQAGTQKMGLLVDELLSLAKVGRHAIVRQAIRLNAVVEEVVTMLEPDIQGREVQWVVDDLPLAECDPVLVKQIFQNLLANALKFTRTRAPAIIQVKCIESTPDGQPVLMVRDNGIGFSMKYVDKLFGVFQRLHRPEDFEGTGIGLATVQRIVQKHGGRVWAEGEVDKGAAFYFTLGLGKQAESKSNGATAGGQS